MTDLPRESVQFYLGDVVHPPPDQVVSQLRLVLTGRVVDETSDGLTSFLVVDCGLRERLLVPAAKALRPSRPEPVACPQP